MKQRAPQASPKFAMMIAQVARLLISCRSVTLLPPAALPLPLPLPPALLGFAGGVLGTTSIQRASSGAPARPNR